MIENLENEKIDTPKMIPIDVMMISGDNETPHWEHGYIRGYISAFEAIDEKITKEIKEDE